MDDSRGNGSARGAAKPAPRKRRKRGEIHLVKRGGYWWARGTLGVRERKFSVDQSLGVPPDEAPEDKPPKHVKDALALLKAELIQRATWGDDSTRTWAHAAAAYLDARANKVAAKGWKVDPEARAVAMASRHFGAKPLASIRTSDIDEFMAKHYPTAGAETARRALAPIGAILHLARSKDWLKVVPHIPRPKQPRHMVAAFLLKAEVEMLIGLADDHMKALIAELFYQGPRGGEPTKLCWEDVDLGKRPAYVYRETKNGEARRLPMHSVVSQWLRWERERQARLYSRVPSGRIYVNSRGKPWHAPAQKYGGLIRKPFGKAVTRLVKELERAGLIDRARIVARCTPHWGRHTFASLRRIAGQDRKLVQILGGWKDQRSMDPYDHLDDEHLREALEFDIADTKPESASLDEEKS